MAMPSFRARLVKTEFGPRCGNPDAARLAAQTPSSRHLRVTSEVHLSGSAGTGGASTIVARWEQPSGTLLMNVAAF